MSSNGKHKTELDAITAITVRGFKSINNEQTIEVRPLTILAGANSSGKSSFIQALLLLKQTVELSFDAGPLCLSGPNARFSSFADILFGASTNHSSSDSVFSVSIQINQSQVISIDYGRVEDEIQILKCSYSGLPNIDDVTLRYGQEPYPIEPFAEHPKFASFIDVLGQLFGPGEKYRSCLRDQCFLIPVIQIQNGESTVELPQRLSDRFKGAIQKVLHLPGLRGAPERAYPKSSYGPEFPGTFESYTASVLAHWQNHSTAQFAGVVRDLQHLGLTSRMRASPLDDTRVELRVGRLPQSTEDDLINISDVGLGVSQVLPVIVACHVAKPGQMVYVEQPEIHLHPKAQFLLARILVDAANRGVRLVVETHSSLLLLGIQAAVAEGKLEPSKVQLNWFERNQATGATVVTSRDLDEAGRFGDWPADFDDVTLRAQADYLDAAEAALARK